MFHTSSLELSRDCSLREIRSIYSQVAAALAEAADLAIDCTRIERADVAFVQVVVSAAITAKREAKNLRLVNVPEVVERAFLRAGLTTNAPFHT